MGEDFRMYLDLDTSNAEEKLRRLEHDKNRVDRLVVESKKKATLSFNQVLSMAQQSWGVMDAMFRAMGINMSMQMRLLVRSSFSVIRILAPIIAAEEVTPGMQAQAAIAGVNLALAIAAIGLAEAEQTQAATQVAALTEGLSGINSMIGSLNFS
jgi:hypothetical protein